MKLLRFFVTHSLRDLWRNRSRTAFALTCVATGVAAVVALRTMAFMVADELTTNLAEINRGDIRLFASSGVPDLVQLSTQGMPVFTSEAERVIRDWANDEQVELTAARMTGVKSLRRVSQGKAETPEALFTFFVEPQYYPFYDAITLRTPAGQPFAAAFPDTGGRAGAIASRLLPKLGAVGALMNVPIGGLASVGWQQTYPVYLITHPRPIVISSNLTRTSSLELQHGDIVRLGAADTLYIVSGIAPSSAETVLTNPQTAFFDYVYLTLGDSIILGEQPLTDQIFIQVPLGRDIKTVEDSLIEHLESTFNTDTDFDKELNRASVPELEKQNSETADIIDDMILVMGLSSLLIGGIGIINTMLVVVSRRTLEIAVLKTLGLKGYRVTVLFIVESLLMGLLGSLIGIVIGVILSYLIRGVGEEAFSLTLQWRLYPEAMFSGLFLGLVITVLFGFLPTLIAGQVRPAIVLRPNEAQMPAAGLLQTLFTLVIMIGVLGVLVSSIVEEALDYGPVYMIAGAGALIGLFAGIITANTRLGQPIPENYQFRLSRRFERLETWITGLTGMLPINQSLTRQERGRIVITSGLRIFRQLILLYGSMAVGIALGLGIFLILSEVWLPFGIGDIKPSNDVAAALDRGDGVWVVSWLGITLLIGFAIRWWGRTLVSLIALGSLGISLGALSGWMSGVLLERLLRDSGIWHSLEQISTGVVLVEGALALLGAIFIGYWLLIWLVSKMPSGMLMGITSLIVSSLVVGIVAVVALLGNAALLLLAIVSVIILIGFRLHIWQHLPLPNEKTTPASTANQLARGPFVVILSVTVLSSGLLLKDVFGAAIRWGGIVLGLVVLFVLWRYLNRRYRVDGRLVLREMAGRRSRVASTLLGLSVGIAGLSLVALTTSAVSHLLEIQLEENAEGNLLIVDPGADRQNEVRDVLHDASGVESFSQFTTYQAVLMEINSEPVERTDRHFAEQDDPHENSNFERIEQGVGMMLSVRDSIADIPDYKMKSGRRFQPDDVGTHRIMVRESFFIEELGIDTGDRLLYLFENTPGEQDDVLVQLTVVGVIARESEQIGLGDQFLVPPDTLPELVSPMNMLTIAMIDESDPVYMDGVLVSLSDVPGVVAIELSVLTQLVKNLLDQLKAIPTLVAWLALVAGTAIIANTVALATQERRRQIGVMKAIGLKGHRVLAMLMAENGLIGLLAGLIGVGVGLLVTVILVLATENPDELKKTLDISTVGWLILLSISVSIAAATLSAWSAAAEKPMNVLRYE